MHLEVSNSHELKINRESKAKISIERPIYTATNLEEIYRVEEDEPLAQRCITNTKAFCTCYNLWIKFLSFFPIITWLPNYRFKKWFVKDLSAGITLGIMQIPQGMAYGMLTTLPAIYGLYNSFIPVLVYFIFGTSRHVSMGTFAITSLMIGEAIDKGVKGLVPNSINGTIASEVDENVENTYRVQYAVTSSFVIGFVEICLGILHSGFITVYLSDPLISGFTTGAAFHIFSSQVKHLVGMKIPRDETGGVFSLFKLYIYIFSHITDVNYGALIIGVIGAILLYIVKFYSQKYKQKIKFAIPAELIVVILGTGLSYGFKFHENFGITILKKVPKGLPPLSTPKFSLLQDVIVDSIIIAIVSYAINVSVAKALAKKNNYTIDANQELYAYGAINVVGSFFSCFVSAASLSRSLIQEDLGSTQVAGIFSCAVVLLALTVLAPLFEPLPNAILASIVLVALKGLFKQFSNFASLLRKSKIDAFVWGISFLAVITLGIDYGLGVGLLVNILIPVYRASRPTAASFNRWKDTDIYCNRKEEEVTDELTGIKILQFQAPLFYGNVEYFQEKLYRTTIEPGNCITVPLKRYNNLKTDLKDTNGEVSFLNGNMKESKKRSQSQPPAMRKQESTSALLRSTSLEFPIGISKTNSVSFITRGTSSSPIHTIIVDCSQIFYADIMGVNVLKNVSKDFGRIGVDFYIVVPPGSGLVRNLEKGGFMQLHGRENIFPTLHDAVQKSLTTIHLKGVCKPHLNKETEVYFEVVSAESGEEES